MIWIVLAVLSSLSALFLLWPLLRKPAMAAEATEGNNDLAVYRQQLNDLENDVAHGVTDTDEAEDIRLEIQRRILRAGNSGDKSGTSGAGQVAKAAILSLGLLVVAFTAGIYYYLGSSDLPSRPLALRDPAAEQQQAEKRKMSGAVQKLIARLNEEPGDIDGWRLLAQSLSSAQLYEKAAQTYLKAVPFAANKAEFYVGAGENFFFHTKGIVDARAKSAFDKAWAEDPEHPGARYYLALYEAQQGRDRQALDQWMALLDQSSSDAPWRAVVEQQIANSARKLNLDPADFVENAPAGAAPPGPTGQDMANAANMTAEERQEMIRNMVGRLEARMKEAPDHAGLMRLGKAADVLGDFALSADAYERAADLQPTDAQALRGVALALIKQADDPNILPDKALAFYRRALALDDHIADALWYVGLSEALSGNHEAALLLWEKLKGQLPAADPLYDKVTEAINRLSSEGKN